MSSPLFEEIRAPHYSLDGRVLHAHGKEFAPFSFNILVNRFPENAIAEIPGHEDYLLRWTSDRWQRGSIFGKAVMDIPTRLRVAEEHFAKLATLGIKTPEHHHVAVGQDVIWPGSVAVYTIVKKLPLVKAGPSPSFIEQHVKSPLRQYYNWVEDSKQPYVMSDIALMRQYGFVNNPTTQELETYLLDIECLVAKATRLMIRDETAKI
jgi:hypothetical protein